MSISQRAGRRVVTVSDDGVGFDTTTPRKPSSLGLAGLRERASLALGRIDIDSRPGAGTRVHARIPVPEPSE